MSKKPLDISEEASVQMPMKTVASLIIIVALGTMGYFQIIERLNVADTRIQIMEKDLEENTIEGDKQTSDLEITNALDELENVNAYLYSIEALMERIFDTKVSKNIELKFKEIAHELAPDPLNVDRLILNRLFHQTPDYPDKKNIN